MTNYSLNNRNPFANANNPFYSNENPYQQFINQRGIKYLVHFTKSSVLPFIFGGDDSSNGILSSKKVYEKFGRNAVYDRKRLDHHSDYVCCSVQRINIAYYETRKSDERRRGDIFNQWAVILINPAIINDETLFCPTNAASVVPSRPGINAFKSLFAQETPNKNHGRHGIFYRPYNLPSCYPTDYQAEVLIKHKIPRRYLLGVAFPPKSQRVEVKRLDFWANNKAANVPPLHVFPWSACTYGFREDD